MKLVDIDGGQLKSDDEFPFVGYVRVGLMKVVDDMIFFRLVHRIQINGELHPIDLGRIHKICSYAEFYRVCVRQECRAQ